MTATRHPSVAEVEFPVEPVACHPECEPAQDPREARCAELVRASWAAHMANEQEIRRAWLAMGGCIDDAADDVVEAAPLEYTLLP